MRTLMGVIKNKHGVYHARKKVPKGLEEATAEVLGSPKPRVAWLKRSLGTKDLREANIRAKPVLMDFDRVLARAKALGSERPLRAVLNQVEIDRMAGHYFASLLSDDDEQRHEGKELLRRHARQLEKEGIEFTPMFPLDTLPEYGLSDEQMRVYAENLASEREVMEKCLAQGDIGAVVDEVDLLLDKFGIKLDKKSASYRKLALAVLRKHVAALLAIDRRNAGDPVETPPLTKPVGREVRESSGLRTALEGWKKVKQRPLNTIREFEHALDWFVQLNGDLPVAKITRRHAREFREALQEVPVRRAGKLRTAALPEIVEWSKRNGGTKKISPATVNKLLGAIQALAVWSRNNGLIDDDVPWADPFSDMRLEQTQPERQPWQRDELRVLFSSPVFTRGHRPDGGRGEAAFWLPLLGLFTGARLNELAPLAASDVVQDEETAVVMIVIEEHLEEGRRLKTLGSRRAIPLHPELLRIGFMSFVDQLESMMVPRGACFHFSRPEQRAALARRGPSGSGDTSAACG